MVQGGIRTHEPLQDRLLKPTPLTWLGDPCVFMLGYLFGGADKCMLFVLWVCISNEHLLYPFGYSGVWLRIVCHQKLRLEELVVSVIKLSRLRMLCLLPLRLLKLLWIEPLDVSTIGRKLGFSQAYISEEVKLLEGLGLINASLFLVSVVLGSFVRRLLKKLRYSSNECSSIGFFVCCVFGFC